MDKMQQFSNNKKNWNGKWNKVEVFFAFLNKILMSTGLLLTHPKLKLKWFVHPAWQLNLSARRSYFFLLKCHIHFNFIIENYLIWDNKLNKSWFRKIFWQETSIPCVHPTWLAIEIKIDTKGMNFPLSN